MYLEDLCYEAQQAAEKAIKAVLIRHGVAYPYIHDLGRLLRLVEEAGRDVPRDVQRAADLTPYALVTRYPAAVGPISGQQYLDALSIARIVVQWAEVEIGDPGQTGWA